MKIRFVATVVSCVMVPVVLVAPSASAGGSGSSIFVSTVAALESEATDPANDGRTVVVEPGVYMLTQRLTLADGLALVSSAGPASTLIDCANVPGLAPGLASFQNPFGCIEVDARGSVDGLTVTDSSAVPGVFPTPDEYERIGILLRNGGSVTGSNVSLFGVGIAAFIDDPARHARFVLERNEARFNNRGTKAYSVATAATARLAAVDNRFEQNFATGFLVQAGGEGGVGNRWDLRLDGNAYVGNFLFGALLIAGDGFIGADANELRVISHNEQARFNAPQADYLVFGAFRFGDLGDPHSDNETRFTMNGGDVGFLVVSAGLNPGGQAAGAGNGVVMNLSATTADVVVLSDGFLFPTNTPAAAGNVTVTGSLNAFHASNQIGVLTSIPSPLDLGAFFTAGQ